MRHQRWWRGIQVGVLHFRQYRKAISKESGDSRKNIQELFLASLAPSTDRFPPPPQSRAPPFSRSPQREKECALQGGDRLRILGATNPFPHDGTSLSDESLLSPRAQFWT